MSMGTVAVRMLDLFPSVITGGSIGTVACSHWHAISGTDGMRVATLAHQ